MLKNRKLYSRNQEYELIYTNLLSVYLVVFYVFYFVEDILLKELTNAPDQRSVFIINSSIFVFMLLCHFIRIYLYREELYKNKLIYYIDKILFLFMLSIIAEQYKIGSWFYIGVLLPIMATTLVKGDKQGMLLLAGSMGMHLSVFFYKKAGILLSGGIIPIELQTKILGIFITYVMLFIATVFFVQLYNCGIRYEIKNKSIIEQFEERYMKLEYKSDEMKQQYENLISKSGSLEESNKRLSKSIAEFYTLHQISQAIGSILDIKELLKRLNDIILGVMGVSYSTIILYDEDLNRLRVNTTNISNINDLATITDNINSGVLMDVLYSDRSILENDVDSQQYQFTCDRDIHSLICIPLVTSTRRFGLVLIEHTYRNAFDVDNVRLLKIIAQQVGIVMENAELYHKMRELARKDGLTDVYNRQYFQEQLEIEYKMAKQEKYPLSLAIFDIDYFKKFNDIYGHIFGDKVLSSVAKVVKSTLRKSDMLARYGGEEFIILLPRTSLAEAYEKVESLRNMISKHVIEDNQVSACVTVSFGVSSFDECVLNENDLLRTADDALYQSKAAGRNCVTTADTLHDQQ